MPMAVIDWATVAGLVAAAAAYTWLGIRIKRTWADNPQCPDCGGRAIRGLDGSASYICPICGEKYDSMGVRADEDESILGDG